MSVLRRILGIFVMLAGVIGLVISIAGLVGIFLVKPVVIETANSTIATLTTSINTSQKALDVTDEALSATVDSVDALSEMLATTAVSVEDTQPIITQVNGMMGETLPATITAAEVSLKAAGEAATSLESAIKSFEVFQAIMSGVPLVSSFLGEPSAPYNPEKPLADSLGDLAVSIQEIPAQFEEMSVNLDKADDNLVLIKTNLETMSASVGYISDSIEEYQSMVADSRSSMDSLKTMLVNTKANLPNILNYVSIGLGVFFLWLLAAQVVIFSQGWELFQGTAGRMESGAKKQAAVEPEAAPEEAKPAD